MLVALEHEHTRGESIYEIEHHSVGYSPYPIIDYRHIRVVILDYRTVRKLELHHGPGTYALS